MISEAQPAFLAGLAPLVELRGGFVREFFGKHSVLSYWRKGHDEVLHPESLCIPNDRSGVLVEQVVAEMRTDGHESALFQFRREFFRREVACAGEFHFLDPVGFRDIERSRGTLLGLRAQTVELEAEMVAEICRGSNASKEEG